MTNEHELTYLVRGCLVLVMAAFAIVGAGAVLWAVAQVVR